MGWNFGDILEAIEPVLPPDAPAFIHGERTIPWREATRLSNNLARGLIARGAVPGDKIAIYMRNRPEYMLAVPANRIGSAVYSAAELKTMQEVITLTVFAGFSVLWLKESLTWNHAIGFALIAAGAFFIFHAKV